MPGEKVIRTSSQIVRRVDADIRKINALFFFPFAAALHLLAPARFSNALRMQEFARPLPAVTEHDSHAVFEAVTGLADDE
jgi:hypothetical protein